MNEFNDNPAPPVTTEREDILAAFRWWVDEYYNDLVFAYNGLVTDGGEKRRYFDQDDATETIKDLELKLKSMITEGHYGDCTKTACTCGRCFAETMYDISSTVNWTWKNGRRVLEEK